MRKNGQNTKKTGQHSECLGHTLKLMHIKFAGRRRQRAEPNCARSLCFPSMTFFDDVAKQAEHSLKIVQSKDQHGTKKTKKRSTIWLNSRGETQHMDSVGVTDSIKLLCSRKTDACRPAGSQYATPGGLGKPVSGLRHLNLNFCVTAPLQNSGFLWGINSY